jgi:hypothetical protein
MADCRVGERKKGALKRILYSADTSEQKVVKSAVSERCSEYY